jgi:ATP-dependent Lon protease
MKGKGTLTLTGHLGDVMKESAQAALSYVRSRARQLGLKPDVFAQHDIHIHVPAGAIPKDGPSAGITMATALTSAFTNRPVRHELAMTGEVTLRGRVLEIGGLKEKILAAKRVGIFKVILPKKNQKDLADIPKHLLKGMTCIFAETMDEVLGAALRRAPVPGGVHAKPAAPARRSSMNRRPVAAASSRQHG